MKFNKLAKAALTLALGVMAGVVFGARTDVNTVPYFENFEGNPGMLWNDGVASMAVTNGWYAGANDLSYVTNALYDMPSGVSAPISGAHTRYLRLNTEGDTLTNDVDNGSFAAGNIWLDTMVQFVVSDDMPALEGDNTIKMATFVLAADSGTNLVVYHGAWDHDEAAWSNAVYTVIPGEIDPSLWYRLTVELDAVFAFEGNAQAFRVLLNGVPIESDSAYGDTWADDYQAELPTGGQWFLSAGGEGAAPAEVETIAFQGTGAIDDLCLRDSDPFDTIPSAVTYLITQVIGDNGGANPGDLSIVIDEGNATSIVYTASEWYRIASLKVNDAEVPAAAGVKSYQWDLLSADQNYSNNVTFTPYAHGYAKATTAWLGQWTEEEVITTGDLDPYDVDTEFLLNTDPTATTAFSFEITVVEASAGVDIAVTVKLVRDTVVEDYNDGNINGTLWLYGSDDLISDPFEEIGGTAVNGTDFGTLGDEKTYTFVDEAGAKKFYKAVIK